MVFSATPCRRAMSGTDAPASCSLRIEMICSSVYGFRFISEPPSGQIIGKSHMLHGSNYRGTVRGSLTLRTDHPCDGGLRRGFYPDNADTSEKPDNGSKGVFQCRKEGSSVWSSSGVLLSRSDSPASVAPRLPVNWGLPRIC